MYQFLALILSYSCVNCNHGGTIKGTWTHGLIPLPGLCSFLWIDNYSTTRRLFLRRREGQGFSWHLSMVQHLLPRNKNQESSHGSVCLPVSLFLYLFIFISISVSLLSLQTCLLLHHLCCSVPMAALQPGGTSMRASSCASILCNWAAQRNPLALFESIQNF